MSALCKIYVRRIKEGIMKLEDVPHHWREEVKSALEVEKNG